MPIYVRPDGTFINYYEPGAQLYIGNETVDAGNPRSALLSSLSGDTNYDLTTYPGIAEGAYEVPGIEGLHYPTREVESPRANMFLGETAQSIGPGYLYNFLTNQGASPEEALGRIQADTNVAGQAAEERIATRRTAAEEEQNRLLADYRRELLNFQKGQARTSLAFQRRQENEARKQRRLEAASTKVQLGSVGVDLREFEKMARGGQYNPNKLLSGVLQKQGEDRFDKALTAGAAQLAKNELLASDPEKFQQILSSYAQTIEEAQRRQKEGPEPNEGRALGGGVELRYIGKPKETAITQFREATQKLPKSLQGMLSGGLGAGAVASGLALPAFFAIKYLQEDPKIADLLGEIMEAKSRGVSPADIDAELQKYESSGRYTSDQIQKAVTAAGL